METWRPVLGWEGFYEVSDEGRVRSLDRMRKKGARIDRGRIRSLSVDRAGYPRVGLCGNGMQVTRLVGHLVAEAFLGPRPDGAECRHLNDEPGDSRAVNLAWGTRTDNEADKLQNRGHYLRKRESCPQGHALVEPNLVRGKLAQGHRNCLACSRARAHASHYRIPFSPELADEKYRMIMAP